MTDLTPEQRIAALKAKRNNAAPAATPTATAPATPSPSKPGGIVISGSRLAAGGVSVASFAAMVVAMGPLTAQADIAPVDALALDGSASGIVPPQEAPSVIVEVVPNYIQVDEFGSPIPSPNDLTQPGVDIGTAVPGPGITPDTIALKPAVAPAPASPAPTAPAPIPAPAAPAAAPAPAAPVVTAAPVTAAPVTAAPATAAPTTAPPAAPAPTNPPPPKSEASG